MAADYEELKQLKGLLDAGVITQEEFDFKKKQILNGTNEAGSAVPSATQVVQSTQKPTAPQSSSSDTGSIGWGVLGFLIPLVGLILYLIWKDNGRPKDSKIAGKGALIGFCVGIAFSLLFGIIVGCTAVYL